MGELNLSKPAKQQLKELRENLYNMKKRQLVDIIIEQIEDNAKLLASSARLLNQEIKKEKEIKND